MLSLGSPQSLSVVLPCLNEERNIEGAVRDVEEAARGLFDDYEIIIVDDGSRDGTGAIASDWPASIRASGSSGIRETSGTGPP